MKMGRKKGFTLVEVLVSISLLAVIVMAVSKAFQQSSIAWDTGWRRVEMIMVGRSVMDYTSRELSKTVFDPNESLSPAIDDPANDSWFWVHDGTNGLYEVKYDVSGDLLRRVVADGPGVMFDNNDFIEIRDFSVEFKPTEINPMYAEIQFDVYSIDKGIEYTMTFQTRSFLMNRYRYHNE